MMKKQSVVAALAFLGALCMTGSALAQIAGDAPSTNLAVTESTQIVTGWSVKKTLLGKAVYNDANQRIGTVADLIVSPDRSVSYVIVGAGGFAGAGRHDVAIPVSQVQDQAGKLVIAGATKDMLKSLPSFEYASDTDKRDHFVAAAERDIAKGKTTVADLETKTDAVSTDVKGKLDRQLTDLRVDVNAAETKLDEMKQATAARWKEFEAGVNAATARLRKAVRIAMG